MARDNTGCLLLILFSLRCVLGAPSPLGELLLDGNSSLLTCGFRSLQFELSAHPRANAPYVFSVKDEEGTRHIIQNATCGMRVTQNPDGALVVAANYSGCFIREKDGEYQLTLGIEEFLDGQQILHEKWLKCPVFPAMDAPSSDLCGTINKADRLACGSLPITQNACLEQSCCYDQKDSSTPCFFANPVTAYCTQTGQAVLAIVKHLTVPSFVLGSVRLNAASSCSGLRKNSNRMFVVYQFPLACGNMYQHGSRTVYENQLVAIEEVISSVSGSITRDSPFRLTMRCSFSDSSSFVSLSLEVGTLPPPSPVSGSGPLVLEMRIATDLTYGTYYMDREYPVLKVLRDPVYVEVRVLQRTDPSLVLVLNQCWATSSSNPVQQPQWPILLNKCPFTGDNYKTQQIQVDTSSGLLFPSHYQRFVISTFTFVDSVKGNFRGQIYFHCSASVCLRSMLNPCLTRCPPSQRKKRMTGVLNAPVASLVTAPESLVTAPESLVTAPESLVTAPGAIDFEDGFPKLQESRHLAQSTPAELRRGALVVLGLLAVVVCIAMWKYRKNLQRNTEAVKSVADN